GARPSGSRTGSSAAGPATVLGGPSDGASGLDLDVVKQFVADAHAQQAGAAEDADPFYSSGAPLPTDSG
ncbi:MAG: hypothetical protein ACR2OD_06325, partial [Gaiellaceae bacterium]